MLLTSRTLARLVAAAALAAAASVVVPTAPASASTCSSADGVSVVVDFHELGGGVRTACVADGGGERANTLFATAGFSLTYVQRQPGFVCQVSGMPADTPCVNTPPADAYWGLWWSDGESGSWTYATTSASGLTVPDGGYVAFSWNGSPTRSTPGASPAPHAAQPTPTATPTHGTPTPTAHPTHTSGTGHASTSPSENTDPDPTDPTTTDPTASTSSRPGHHKSRSASPTPTPESPTATDPTSAPADAVPALAEPEDPGDGGLPAWVAPVVIVALFAGAAGAAVVRRRRGASGP